VPNSADFPSPVAVVQSMSSRPRTWHMTSSCQLWRPSFHSGILALIILWIVSWPTVSCQWCQAIRSVQITYKTKTKTYLLLAGQSLDIWLYIIRLSSSCCGMIATGLVTTWLLWKFAV
jgi:hypothetical protein